MNYLESKLIALCLSPGYFAWLGKRLYCMTVKKGAQLPSLSIEFFVGLDLPDPWFDQKKQKEKFHASWWGESEYNRLLVEDTRNEKESDMKMLFRKMKILLPFLLPFFFSTLKRMKDREYLFPFLAPTSSSYPVYRFYVFSPGVYRLPTHKQSRGADKQRLDTRFLFTQRYA